MILVREVVAVDLGETFNADPPRPLFAGRHARDDTGAFSTPNYDIMPDGQAFVMVRPAAIGSANPAVEGEGSAVILVQNFFEELGQVGPE